MLQRQEPRTNPETESLALIARGLVADVDKRNFKRGEKPWCDHCKKPWHTRETCRKLHGKPPNWKKKNGGDGYVFQVSNEDQGNQVFSDKLPFTKKQIDSLCKLFQSSSLIVNPSSSCSLAQKGNYYTTSLYSVKPNSNCPWIIDSGATDYRTGSSKLFSSYSPCVGNQKIKIADGSLSAIVEKGSIVISPSITLHNVLHIPNSSCNLLFVSEITHDLKCRAHFSHSSYVFYDLD